MAVPVLSVHWSWTYLLGKGRDSAMGIVESERFQPVGLEELLLSSEF